MVEMNNSSIDQVKRLISLDFQYELKQHHHTYLMYSSMLDAYLTYRSAAPVEQIEIEEFLTNECDDRGFKFIYSHTILRKIIKLYVGPQTKVVSAAELVVNILISKNLNAGNCVEWLKHEGGLNTVRRKFNADGSVKDYQPDGRQKNNKLEQLQAFVTDNFKEDMNESELTVWLFNHLDSLHPLLTP